MDYVEKARALRADPAVHYNCCQAVLVTFADRLEKATLAPSTTAS